MRRTFPSLAALVTLAVSSTACGTANNAAPVATPTVTVNVPVAPIGSPIEMSYRFVVAPTAPALSDDYQVFVHFLDTDGELMWTDDHQPPRPISQWKPGATIEYTRTMFIPKFPYVGETRVEIGLFSRTTGDRLPMTGDTLGQNSYRVARFEMALQSDNLFVVFRDGWYGAEAAGVGLGVEWQWSKKDATLTFANPKRDVRLYLSVDQPSMPFPEPQKVEVRVGQAIVDTFNLAGGQSELRQIRVPGTQLGAGEIVEVTISVDKTFVPAEVPAVGGTDSRELGIRVFRAFVQPL